MKSDQEVEGNRDELKGDKDGKKIMSGDEEAKARRGEERQSKKLSSNTFFCSQTISRRHGGHRNKAKREKRLKDGGQSIHQEVTTPTIRHRGARAPSRPNKQTQ